MNNKQNTRKWQPWSYSEDVLLCENISKMNQVELWKKLFPNRTLSSIRNRIHTLGILQRYQNVNSKFFEDYDHLLNIKTLMSVKTEFSKDNNCYIMVVGNKELYRSVVGFGGMGRKTKKISIEMMDYDKPYFYDFLRGYFDGDGSIIILRRNGKEYLSGVKFTGAKKILSSLNKVLKNMGYKSTLYQDPRVDKSDCWYLSLYGKSCRLLLDKMYRNSRIHLQRKKDIYLKFKPFMDKKLAT